MFHFKVTNQSEHETALFLIDVKEDLASRILADLKYIGLDLDFLPEDSTPEGKLLRYIEKFNITN